MNSRSFQIKSSIPVLRMFDEQQAQDFYLEFLGYQVEWKHRFRKSDDSPLYMQIRLGESVIHLDGHAELGSPISNVRIPVTGLHAFAKHLCEKNTAFPKPVTVDPRNTGHANDLNITDPFDNRLVFWEPQHG